MEATWRTENIFLGSGGSSPGVSQYDIDSGEIEQVLSLPAQESVYALGVSPDGTHLVAGTKAGFLYEACRVEIVPQDGGIDIRKITHGYSILSVLFVDTGTVAVSDTAGRCFLWHLTGMPYFKELSTDGSVVCSLFRVTADRLAGLTLEGRLLIWRWPTGQIQQELSVPIPPAVSALVKPIYWAAANAWVWTGREGLIVIYPMDGANTREIKAHEGELYALATCNEELLTVGREDGVLMRWQHGGAVPVGRYRAPLGTVALTAWGMPGLSVMLVDDRGTAGIYDLSGDTLGFVSGVRGREFRVILGPDQQRLAWCLGRRRMQQAQEITHQIREQSANDELGCIEQLHRQLIELGYEHQSLALRAEAARQDNDIVSELKYSRQAAAFVSETDRGAYGLLLRYLTLLEAVWQLSAAYDLCNRLAHQQPGEGLLERALRLEKYVRAMEGTYVIESNQTLRVLSQSTNVMGKPFHGRYLLTRGNPMSTGVPGITPSLLISEYRRVCMDYTDALVPPASEAVLSWLSQTSIERVTAVLFEGGDACPVPGLEFGLKLYDVGLQTVLVPVALFNADAGLENLPMDERNRQTSHRVDMLDVEAAWTGWLRSAKFLAYLAVKMIINTNRSQLGQPPKVDYGKATEQDNSREQSECAANVFDSARAANRSIW